MKWLLVPLKHDFMCYEILEKTKIIGGTIHHPLNIIGISILFVTSLGYTILIKKIYRDISHAQYMC